MKATLDGRLSTGVDILDRQLDGGIPAGHMVALTSPPDAQSELLLEGVAGERETLYLSTVRSEREIRDALGSRADAADVTIEHVPPSARFRESAQYLQQLGDRTNLIIDTANGLEMNGRDDYLRFLNALKERLHATGSVAVLHCIDGNRNPDNRDLTLNRSDLTWRLSLEVDSTEVRTQLLVSKFRGGRALLEPVKLKLTDRVEIDISRDI